METKQHMSNNTTVMLHMYFDPMSQSPHSTRYKILSTQTPIPLMASEKLRSLDHKM